MKILLIEDSAGDVELVQGCFDQAGAVGVVLSVEESLAGGLARLRQEKPDLVLVDLDLPDTQGLGAVRGIVSQAPSVPLVVVSGGDDERLALQAVRLGAQEYLVKGRIEPEQFVMCLRNAVERHRRMAELQRASTALESRESEHQTLLENLPDPALVISETGAVLFASPRAETEFGRQLEGAGRALAEVGAPEGAPANVQVAMPGGDARTFETRASRIRWRGEDAILHLLRDMTHKEKGEAGCLRKVKRQLEQAEQAHNLGLLAGRLANDLNNHVGVILGISEMSLELARADSFVRADLERIHEAATSVHNLVQQLMEHPGRLVPEVREGYETETPEERFSVAQVRPGEAVPAGLPEGSQVLVVDDEPGIRFMFQAALEGMGCKVVTASNGPEAIETFAGIGKELTAVLLDLEMPGMGGEQVLARFLRMREDIPVLMVTGCTDDEIRSRLAQGGHIGVLKKPFSLAGLKRSLLEGLAPEAVRGRT